MNREIKFRVWDTGRNRFVETGEFIFNIIDLELDLTDRFIAQQYTGLKDSKGREVYEGDIIQYYIPWNRQTVVRLVKYDETFLSFFAGSVDESFVNLCDVLDMENIEVIGNIHQNPELLKSLSENE